MKHTFRLGAAAAASVLVLGLAACGSSGGGGDAGSQEITYWATNQGQSLDHDREVLSESLERFTEETGIKVNLEVIPWTDMYNRILTAVTSGDGPDVLNIGNTWAVTLQETGAFEPVEGEFLEAIGGQDRFMSAAWATAGAEGKAPTSVPLYSQAYSLYYNTELFEEAGIDAPPATWDEFVETAKKLTKDTDGDGKIDQWGISTEAGAVTNGAHHSFIRGKQHGGAMFDADGQPTFNTDAQIDGVAEWVDLMGTHKVMSPSDAEMTNGADAVANLIDGRAAMVFNQNPVKNFTARDFEDWGVAPMPLVDGNATGDRAVMSFAAGSNVSVFKNSDSKDAAYQLVAHLTDTEEQVYLNDAYTSLPTVADAYDAEEFQNESAKLKEKTLADHAQPMPLVAQEGQMETLVGTAVKNLFAQAATGTVTRADVERALTDAQNQMTAAQ
ncbi:extracellular solute-binding protein [Zafaria sp. Z1313]|uniref:extracellular solute-binding protein n=1 Tax=Zafaria sp. Z1313 TaxID=3423202 RepID=UPI003D302A6B